MKIKTFSVAEANSAIPKIKECFDDIYVMRKRASFLKGEMKWIVEFWGKDLYDSDNADHERFMQIEEELDRMQGRMISKLEKIESFGCVVKDVDIGLVDFYSMINGQLSFLCWKYGEKEISNWHPVQAGFGGRRPLDHTDSIENK